MTKPLESPAPRAERPRPSAAAPARLDVDALRAQFPILQRRLHGRPLIYLDNAATSQKPRQVLDAITRYYEEENANVHRGVHFLSERATKSYEDARAQVQRFLGAGSPQEIVFVRGTTEGINLVAQSFARPRLRPGDAVVISTMEHHSNIVPWQLVCEATGARLRVIPIDDRGVLDLDAFEALLDERTRLVSVVHVSNALGTVNPVKDIIARAHARGIPVLIDGAQAVPHQRVDVRELDCDFYAFSGHKVFGPTGIGALYGKRQHLDAMPPYQGGGDMILSVSFEKTVYNRVPYKFEAGTPHIEGAIGLGAALDFLSGVGLEAIAEHEHELLAHGTETLGRIDGLRFIGTAPDKVGVLSFVLDGIHPHDAGTVLDQEGIAVRAGHHCAQPVLERLGVTATLRASLALYNTKQEIDRLAEAIGKVREVLH